MNQDEIYKFFGLFVIIMSFVYILARAFNYQSQILEGLTNPSSKNNKKDVYANLDKLVKVRNDKLEDSLLLDKYKVQFEDTIIELDKNTDLKLLQLIALYGEAVDTNNEKEMTNLISVINQTASLKTALQHGMDYLDKK